MNLVESNFLLAKKQFDKHINSIASHAYIPTYDIDDLKQELLQVLFSTVCDYDPYRGATFGTVFYRRAKNHLTKLYHKMNTQKRKASYVWIEEEEIQVYIDNLFQEPSAEQEVFAKLAVFEFAKQKAQKIA